MTSTPSTVNWHRRPHYRVALLCRFAAARRFAAKKRLSTAGVNDCAGFLHTLTTGFNHDALIVHI